MTWLPLHLGSLHAYETALLMLLAFGPCVVLAIVVVVLRRRDVAEEERLAASPHQARADRAADQPAGARHDEG